MLILLIGSLITVAVIAWAASAITQGSAHTPSAFASSPMMFETQPSVTTSDRMIPHFPTILGAALSLNAFFFLPWVEFSPVPYVLDRHASLINTLSSLLHIIGQDQIAAILSLLQTAAGIPGWLLMVVIPTTNWLVRITLFLVPWTGGLALLWMALSLLFRPQSNIKSIFAIGQAISASIGVIGLLVCMPTIDAFGDTGNSVLRLLAVVAGVRMTWYVWLAWLGLVLLTAGGVIETAEASATASQAYGYQEEVTL
jgi:hypothetical protein